ncbi:MAG TPA: hypothetical protein VFL86_29925 [Burkholderiaceae bacterium]|nr:hypothetical protein [Burkholderiaceae bacterium]
MTEIQSPRTSTPWPRALLAASCCLLLATGAQADPESSVRPLLGGGLTVGGDTMIDVTFVNKSGQTLDTAKVKAGQLLQVYGGLEYQPVSRFSLQATLGYHWHNAEGSDGQAKFSRYPVELLGHYHINENWRIGGGARFVRGAKRELHISNPANPIDAEQKFDNTTGSVIEGEYVVDRKLGFKLRYVSEKYKAQAPFTEKFDGSHVGLLVNWYLGSTD